MHLLGGEGCVLRDVNVLGDGHVLGRQPMRLAADGVAFKLTAFDSDNSHFEEHAWRLLRHLELRAILWVNIAVHRVTFTTIGRDGL